MMTDTYTHPCLPLILRARKHAHSLERFFYNTPRSASWHTHTSSCVLEICLMMTHTYTHPCPRVIALHNTYFSSMFTGAFPLHACDVTRNWRTYFISVRRVFLVETVVLQTVLWDIRAWSARFLDLVIGMKLLIVNNLMRHSLLRLETALAIMKLLKVPCHWTKLPSSISASWAIWHVYGL